MPNLLARPSHPEAEKLAKLLDEIEVTLFPHKFIEGGTLGDRVPLSFLLESFNTDAHYQQYTHDLDTRLRKDMARQGWQAQAMIVDLDAHGVEFTDDDVHGAIFSSAQLDHPPNVVVRTKGGLHFWYFIAPIHDPEEFEQKRVRLLDHVRPIERVTPLGVDPTPDWTRLLRAPRVLREDGTDLRDTLVWGCHSKVLDTGSWKIKAEAKPKPRRVTTGTPDVRAAVRYAAKVPGAVSGQGGHNATFRLACALIRKFHLTEEQALQVLEAWNQYCDPPWSERDLEHKVRDAIKATTEE